MVIAWISLTLAFQTDWPTSFWITALGAAAYVVSGLVRRPSARETQSADANP